MGAQGSIYSAQGSCCDGMGTGQLKVLGMGGSTLSCEGLVSSGRLVIARGGAVLATSSRATSSFLRPVVANPLRTDNSAEHT